jgi:glutamyl-tRNA synthetase
MKNKIRVRFAPSPTGALHLGGIRTALYNYLFAKQNGGDFILRIEDTDKAREVAGSVDYIKESLEWLGMVPDEGPGYGGEYGPYTQSERNDFYGKVISALVDSGHAYYAFDTQEELDAVRANNPNFKYGYWNRMRMRNSLSLPADDVDQMLLYGVAFTIRAKMDDEIVEFDDVVRGKISVKASDLDDKVLFKSDGTPTYHLANVVDDFMMGITHVIRGEEWLPSAPLHVLLYRWMKWTEPVFVHLPLILGPRGKFSKRDGEAYGFPVYPLSWAGSAGYRDLGFLPGAVLNIAALLGWSHPDGTEIFSLDEMVRSFDLGSVHKAGAKFDLDKAKWISREHIKKTAATDLAALIRSEIPLHISDSDLSCACGLTSSRAGTLTELIDSCMTIFSRPDGSYYKEIVDDESLGFLCDFRHVLSDVAPGTFNAESAKAYFDATLELSDISPRKAGIALRAILCGNKVGPSIFEIMGLLGLIECLERLERA